MKFDIENFYPAISEDLLERALEVASRLYPQQQQTTLSTGANLCSLAKTMHG